MRNKKNLNILKLKNGKKSLILKKKQENKRKLDEKKD